MNFLRSLVQKFAGKPVDWDELEESLIRADLGVPMSLRIVEELQKRATTTTITANDIAEVARDEIGRVLPIAPPPIRPLPAGPKVILIVGVNGTGKTTTLAVIREAAERQGYQMEGFAPTTRAAKLLEESGIHSSTLQKFLTGEAELSDRPHFFVLDESSLASTRQMNQFLLS
jgi:signal recognition particle GTPase